MYIGDYLKMQRKKKGLTLVDVGALAGFSKAYISRIERNEAVGWDAINKVLAALELSVDDANAAGVSWWASTSTSSSNSSDLDYIYSWLQKQDDKTVRRIRLLVESIEKSEE